MSSVDPDRLLNELAEEVGVFWKELATDAGFRIHKIKVIEKEARTPKEQALEMLWQLRSKMGHSNFSVDEVRARMRKIKQKQYDTQLKRNISDYSTGHCFLICNHVTLLDLILPENVRDEKNLCGRKDELDGILKQFWGELGKEEDIPQFCLQVPINLT